MLPFPMALVVLDIREKKSEKWSRKLLKKKGRAI